MIKTLNPYSDASKTAEIMSRYRPIAPKPEVPNSSDVNDGSSVSQKIRQSPYLRNLWPQLQARPTRTRKRGRAAISPPTVLKRPRTHLLGLSSPTPVTSHAGSLSLQTFGLSNGHGLPHHYHQLAAPNLRAAASACGSSSLDLETTHSSLVTLPLLPCSPPAAATQIMNCMEQGGGERVIDLNSTVEVVENIIPEEIDLLQQLRGPPRGGASGICGGVIAPQPLRPVGSRIIVGRIKEDPIISLSSPVAAVRVPKKPEEVEEEVECEMLPAVVSDSNNKVRLANSAYKEMVGQPECPWLESMVGSEGCREGKSKRICGEVMLHFSDDHLKVPVSSNGFSCWVTIEWGSQGNKNSVNAFCDVIRLCCQSKDYVFTWRFHTHTSHHIRTCTEREASLSISKSN